MGFILFMYLFLFISLSTYIPILPSTLNSTGYLGIQQIFIACPVQRQQSGICPLKSKNTKNSSES